MGGVSGTLLEPEDALLRIDFNAGGDKRNEHRRHPADQYSAMVVVGRRVNEQGYPRFPRRTVFDVEVPRGLGLSSAIAQVQVWIVRQEATTSARAWLKRASSSRTPLDRVHDE